MRAVLVHGTTTMYSNHKCRCTDCSDAARDYQRAYRARGNRRTPAKNRAILLRQYGLDEAGYAALLDEQGGVCALCGLPPDTKALSIDHNHETGRVRGLLHTKCNLAIGNLDDSMERALAAAAYLAGSSN